MRKNFCDGCGKELVYHDNTGPNAAHFNEGKLSIHLEFGEYWNGEYRGEWCISCIKTRLDDFIASIT